MSALFDLPNYGSTRDSEPLEQSSESDYATARYLTNYDGSDLHDLAVAMSLVTMEENESGRLGTCYYHNSS